MKKPSFKRERVDSKILSGFQNIQLVVNQPGLSNLQLIPGLGMGLQKKLSISIQNIEIRRISNISTLQSSRSTRTVPVNHTIVSQAHVELTSNGDSLFGLRFRL